MTHVPDTTIAALLFAHAPNVNFAHVVGDLSRALALCPGASPVLTWDRDDIALFDMPGARIVLGWAEGLGGAHDAACLVSAGPGALPVAERDALGGRHEEVCGMIAGRLETLHAPALTIWHRIPGMMTPEVLDDITEHLAAQAMAADGEQAEGTTRAAQTEPQDAATARTGDSAAASRIDRLMIRMELEFARRDGTAAVSGTGDPRRGTTRNAPAAQRPAARRTVTARHVDTELLRLRMALYPAGASTAAPDQPLGMAPRSLPLRLAVGTMSATMVLAAAPVGAALLTYNALGGADLRMTARGMALCGAASGLAQAQFLRDLIPAGLL